MEVRLPPGCLDKSKGPAWESELAVTREGRVASGPWRVTAQGGRAYFSNSGESRIRKCGTLAFTEAREGCLTEMLSCDTFCPERHHRK